MILASYMAIYNATPCTQRPPFGDRIPAGSWHHVSVKSIVPGFVARGGTGQTLSDYVAWGH